MRERERQLAAGLEYFTAMFECDTIFPFGSLNNFACRDRVAAQYDRTRQWVAEKEILREELQRLMEKSRSVQNEEPR